MKTQINEIRKLLFKGEVEEALNLLWQLLQENKKLNEVILQSARRHDLEREVRTGQITREEASRRKNQIVEGLTSLCDEIDGYKAKNLTKALKIYKIIVAVLTAIMISGLAALYIDYFEWCRLKRCEYSYVIDEPGDNNIIPLEHFKKTNIIEDEYKRIDREFDKNCVLPNDSIVCVTYFDRLINLNNKSTTLFKEISKQHHNKNLANLIWLKGIGVGKTQHQLAYLYDIKDDKPQAIYYAKESIKSFDKALSLYKLKNEAGKMSEKCKNDLAIWWKGKNHVNRLHFFKFLSMSICMKHGDTSFSKGQINSTLDTVDAQFIEKYTKDEAEFYNSVSYLLKRGIISDNRKYKTVNDIFNYKSSLK